MTNDDDSDEEICDRRIEACPVCGGRLIMIKQKQVCETCRTIVQTCCD